MTNNNHPITPPDDLQEQWKQEWLSVRPAMTPCIQWLLAKSSQWGYEQRGANNEDELQQARDQELEACNGWLVLNGYGDVVDRLRAARRPKPPSLKEQALMALDDGDTAPGACLTSNEVDIIRRALEALPDD